MSSGVLLLLAAFAAPQVSHASFTILLTSFDPFGGRAQNNTQPIVADLAQMAASLGSDVIVKTCNLPVVYDRGAEVAMDCVAQDKPDVVVSFGEAFCSLQLESAATNWDADGTDNAGNDRTGSEIVPGGPHRSAFDFPVPAMYCALGSQASSLVVSDDPGAFVCNNTAYHLSQELTPMKIPYTFIHVPSSECSPADTDPQANANKIATMLKAAIVELRSGSSEMMPSTQSEAQNFLQGLQNAKAPACEIQYAQQLLSDYPNSDQSNSLESLLSRVFN